MRIITRDIVSAIIISGDNKMFFGRKDPKKGGVYVDCWHLPGGGVDEGETKEEALLREIKEEIGIDILGFEVELVDSQGSGQAEKTLKDSGEKVLCNMKFYVYEVVIEDKDAEDIEVKLEDDLVEFKWFSKEDLEGIKLTPPSVELFARIY